MVFLGILVKKEVSIVSILTKLPIKKTPKAPFISERGNPEEDYFPEDMSDSSYSNDIEKLKEKVSSAYSNLDNVVDPLLIDSWIYEINAAQLRYQFCLQQLKNAPRSTIKK